MKAVRACVAVAGVLSATALNAQTPVRPGPAVEFVGTTPCADVRPFVGGIEPGATWRIAKGAAGDAVVYELAAAGKEAPILPMKGDANVLFLLNQQRQMLVGPNDVGSPLNLVTGSGVVPQSPIVDRSKAN